MHKDIAPLYPQISHIDSEFSLLVAFCRKEATRTPDPYVPNVVRYQLRYFPNCDAKVKLFFGTKKLFVNFLQ